MPLESLQDIKYLYQLYIHSKNLEIIKQEITIYKKYIFNLKDLVRFRKEKWTTVHCPQMPINKIIITLLMNY